MVFTIFSIGTSKQNNLHLSNSQNSVHQESLALKEKIIYECGLNNLTSAHGHCDTTVYYLNPKTVHSLFLLTVCTGSLLRMRMLKGRHGNSPTVFKKQGQGGLLYFFL